MLGEGNPDLKDQEAEKEVLAQCTVHTDIEVGKHLEIGTGSKSGNWRAELGRCRMATDGAGNGGRANLTKMLFWERTSSLASALLVAVGDFTTWKHMHHGTLCQ